MDWITKLAIEVADVVFEKPDKKVKNETNNDKETTTTDNAQHTKEI